MVARTTANVPEVNTPRSTRIITCANHKGGTGKTTTAVNVSAGLALLTQQRVLLIDCDPRGHASMALGVERAHVRYRLPHVIEEILYPAMEDFQLDIIIGQGPSARTIKLALPHFTLVGATTRAGLLTSPLRDRFGVVIRLDFYTQEELQT